MAIYNAIMAFTNWMWTFPILALLIGGGLVITVACDFVQIKHFGYMLKATFGDAAHSKSEEGISSWSAMVATLANTIGTGNIIGVGSAIALGGPGAVFWMWVIGFVAMALKYSEALLGVYTREKDANGQWRGGANIYLAKIWKPLGWIWAITCCFGMAVGCGVHTGAISSSVHTFGVPSLITTVVCCVIIVLVILGGLGALVKVTDKLVPAMAIIYMAAGTLLIILNIQNLIPALISVFTNAFTGTAATGGFAGAALAATIKNGCSRGVYSNDGGNGSASILHAQANTNEPVKQGMFGIFEVFADTIVICTLTAMVILCSGVPVGYGSAAGAELTISGFTATYGGWSSIFTAVALCSFAFSTIIGWGLYGSRCIEFLFHTDKVVGPFLVVYSFVSILGATVDLGLLWSIADTFNGLMSIPNLMALLLLSGTVAKLTKEFFAGEGAQK